MTMINIYTACKQGRARSGSDIVGNTTHALKIPKNRAIALCGTKPSGKSNGWIGDSSKKVTCPKCLKKLDMIDNKIKLVYPKDIDMGF